VQTSCEFRERDHWRVMPEYVFLLKRYRLMAHAYFDDSGKFTDSDFVCLAGYVSYDAGWAALVQKWEALLVQHKIPYIHMKDLMALRGPYETLGWDTKHRDEVLNDFIDVIRESVVAGFGVVVDAKYYRSLGKGIREQLGDPFMFCFQRILRRVVKKLRDVGYPYPISAVFDDCEQYSVRCYRMWSRLRKWAPDIRQQIPSISFADDSVLYPLQTADILAWQTNKYLRQKAGNFQPTEHMKRLMMSTTPGYALDYISEMWNQDGLDKLWAGIQRGEFQILERV